MAKFIGKNTLLEEKTLCAIKEKRFHKQSGNLL